MTMTYDRARYWSDVADRIAQRVARRDVAGDDDAYFAYKRGKMLGRFLATLPVNGKVVLELGCGPGGNLEYLLAQKPARLIGVDIAPGMLELARERLTDRATLLQTDGITIAVPDRSIDIAYTITVLQHNVEDDQMRAAIAELARVSRGEVVLMEDLAAPGQSRRWETFVARELRDYEDAARAARLRLRSSTALRTRLSRAGWHRLRARFTIPPEGGRQSLAFRALMAAWVIAARPLDTLLPDHDFTRMVFVHS